MKLNAFPYPRAIVALSLALATPCAVAETIMVSAAASLADAFSEIARLYEAAHPADTVQTNFGGSGALWQQIDKGAPVDVFASADAHTMDTAQRAGMVAAGTRVDFAGNALVLVQPLAAAATLYSIQGLHDPSVRRIAVGNPESVPVGRYSRAALDAAGLWSGLGGKLIFAQNVRQALHYVVRGEVDAALVYRTDAATLQDRVRLAGTVATDPPVRYPIAVMRHGDHKPAARRFVDFVLSPAGQETLSRYGFEPADGR